MSGGSPATATQYSQVKLPAWVEQASQANYQFAKDVAGRPLTQFEGQTVAGPSPYTQQGYDWLSQNAGKQGPLYDEAFGWLRQSTDPLDVNKYLNPYREEVESRAVDSANRALTQQLGQVSDATRRSGAFGGSRGAVESAVTRGEGIRGIGDLVARLRAQGFDTATANALADRQRFLPAAQSMLAGAGQQQQGWMNELGALFGAGAQQQGYQQKLLDAAQKKFYEARDYPVEQLNLLLASLGMSPYGKSEEGFKTSQQEQLPTDWASVLLGAGKIGAQIYSSDREDKTDIKKLGTDPLAGIPIYSYRYKDDPKTYPKVVGPMAQDIEKKFPSAVKKVGRHKVVDINNLMEVLA